MLQRCLQDNPEAKRELSRFLNVNLHCLEAHVLGVVLVVPLRDLVEGLGQGVDDYVGSAAAEALDGLLDGLVEVVGGVPEADDDAIVGQVGADALADGSGLREGEGWEGGDEDYGVGFGGEGVEDFAGDVGGGEEEGLMVGALHELAEHEGGELVSLVADGDADDGELFVFVDGA